MRRGLDSGQKERGREEISQEMGLRKSVEKVNLVLTTQDVFGLFFSCLRKICTRKTHANITESLILSNKLF